MDERLDEVRTLALTVCIWVDGLFVCHYSCCCIVNLSTKKAKSAQTETKAIGQNILKGIFKFIICMHYGKYANKVRIITVVITDS